MSNAYAINDLGQVVGIATGPSVTGTGETDYATMWNGRTITKLGNLPGTGGSDAYNINNAGQVVGTCIELVGERHATLWNGSTPIDLNTLLDSSGVGWLLVDALAINDVGQIVGWGFNGLGQQEAFLLTPEIPINVSGTVQEGRTLTAIGIANDGDAVIGYQWQVLNGSTWTNIAGATGSTYKLTEANEGHQLRVAATSSDADGGGTSATSTPTDSVTNSTYTIAETDENLQLRVVASFTDDTGQAISAASTPTAVVVDVAPKLTVSVTGNAIEGSILTATPLATSDDGGTTTYQWQGLIGTTWANITGATGATYTAAEADESHRLRVVATFTDDTGQTTSATSAATAAVVDVAPALTISNSSLTVPAGGSVPMGISVTVPDADDTVSVKITGLPSYETVIDNLDHTTFHGNSIVLSAAEVNSGLTLHSSYGGTGHPVATLKVTAANTTSGESATAAAQTITVTDPPGAPSVLKVPSQSVTGQITDLAFGEAFDQANIANTMLGYWGNGHNTGGTQSVSDGSHTANVALLVQYLASSFAMASDGHSGTLITDPPPNQQQFLLTQPHG